MSKKVNGEGIGKRAGEGMKKKTKLIIAGCCAAVLVVAGIGVALWHPWDAGENGGAGDAAQVDVGDVPAGAGASGTASGDVAQGDGWVLDMFRNLAPMVGSGRYEAWTEVTQDGAWDFKVEQPAGGEAAYFAFSEEYAAMAERTGTPLTVFALVEATNAKVEDDEVPFVSSAGAGDYTLCDADGQPVAYDANDALRALAQSAYAYRASWEGPEDEKTLEEYAAEYAQKLDNMGMTTIRGTTGQKGKAEVYFTADTSDERIMEIIEEVGCEWVEGGLMDLGPAIEPYKYAVVATAVGGEEAAMDAFDEYPEVRSTDTYGGSTFVEAETSSSAAVSSGQASRSIDSWLQYYLRYSGFTDAWDTVKCNGSVTIGIIDSGIDWDNTELLANVDTTHMANACGNPVVTGTSADMTDVGLDENGNLITHGTHVAAVASAIAGDGYGCDGASYNATILPVKATSSDGLLGNTAILSAYTYLIHLDDPPDVINLSFARGFPSKTEAETNDYVQQLQTLVNEAWDKGIVTVAASGNDGGGLPQGTVGSDQDEETGVCVPVNGYNYPACLDHVISVGALDTPGWLDNEATYVPHLAEFSNTTSDVDLAAYGVNIHITNAYSDDDMANWFTTVDGTSFAAPQAAAAAALVKAAHPGYGADDIEDALGNTTADVGEADSGNPRSGYGSGSLDAEAAVMWSNLEGSGGSGGSGDSDSSGSGGSWSPTAGGSLLDTYREAKEQ